MKRTLTVEDLMPLPTWWGSIGRDKGPQRFTLHAAYGRRSPRTFCGLHILAHSNKPGGFRVCESCLRIAQVRQQRHREAEKLRLSQSPENT